MQPREERRRTPRTPIGNLVAHVDLRDGSEPILVCVWDMSLGGACLMISPDIAIPDQFDLVIDGLKHPVKKVWQRWSQLGVQLRLA